MLDMSFTLGNLPQRVRDFHGDTLDNYFRLARGRGRNDQIVRYQLSLHRPGIHCRHRIQAGYLALLEQLAEAKAQSVKAKPVIIGPVTLSGAG